MARTEKVQVASNIHPKPHLRLFYRGFRGLLLQSDTNPVRIGALDAARIDVMNRHDALEHAMRTMLPYFNHPESRRASGGGMRVTAERVGAAEGDKDAIPGRGHIRKVRCQSFRSSNVEIDRIDVLVSVSKTSATF
jgi:hypothetical protein